MKSRTEILILLGGLTLLVVVYVVFVRGLFISSAYSVPPIPPAPPGQFPIEEANEQQVQWTATEKVKSYRPGSDVEDGFGTNNSMLPPDIGSDAKRISGLSQSLGRCVLPTVPLGPQFIPKILLAENEAPHTTNATALLE